MGTPFYHWVVTYSDGTVKNVGTYTKSPDAVRHLAGTVAPKGTTVVEIRIDTKSPQKDEEA